MIGPGKRKANTFETMENDPRFPGHSGPENVRGSGGGPN